MIEQTFNNRYRLDSKLGEGGMAEVYCGTDTLLRRRVAVKVLRAQYAADEEFVRRFYQEAESAARLTHPNIVNTFDVGREGDLYYIVMELVDGPSLAEIIAVDGRLPEPVAIDYAAQICNGLAYAHRQGLLHRDIKPANILVTKDDVVKLSDFGIARAVSQHTMTLTKPGLVMGSVYYISPEQAQGHELNETSDLYSVGVVLYQMLTGKLPFTGESPVTVALKHIGDPVPTIDTSALEVSPALAAIDNKLLQKRPENRFSSASEVASALREARDRPLLAAYATSNDAPTQMFSTIAPPPVRRSPMPDRPFTSISMDEERRSAFGGRAIAVLVVLLAIATVVGYLAFGRSLPVFSNQITVGDYRNMTDAQAQQTVVNAGLVAHFSKTASDTIPANHVISQNPAPGARVDKNSIVQLIVSNGLPLVGLRDVTNFTLADAIRDLTNDKFQVRTDRRFDATLPKDTVISQNPKPRSNVRQGSTITLLVSDGPPPLKMPNLVSLPLQRAQQLANKLGVTLDASQQGLVPSMPAGVVITQDVDPGTQLTKGQVIHVTVNQSGYVPTSAPGVTATVPDIATHPLQEATVLVQRAGFQPLLAYRIQPDRDGTIVDQNPHGGSTAPLGSQVTITLAVPGEVPDTDGMTIDQARDTLAAAGYSIGTVEMTPEGAGGRVVMTRPDAGTRLPPGSSVTLIVNGHR